MYEICAWNIVRVVGIFALLCCNFFLLGAMEDYNLYDVTIFSIGALLLNDTDGNQSDDFTIFEVLVLF